MSLVKHARKELELVGLFSKDSDYDGMIGKAVMELVEKFSEQGHSGCSANVVSNLFNKLSRFKTISPLTGEDEEWTEIEKGRYQNKRNSAVFKDEDGKPYYIDAYIKKAKNGDCWGGSLTLRDDRRVGKCHIKDFANMPTITIDVLEEEVSKDNWEMWMKDESQLEELAKYYDFEII